MSAQLIHEVAPLRVVISEARKNEQRIGFVPTMGNLHEGHLSLVKSAQNENDVVVVSIFVNPLQFAAHEDLTTYPRTMAADVAKLNALGVDVIFNPTLQAFYPAGLDNHSKVTVPTFEAKACAISRPHFFSGVATVVMKLFSIVQPDVAYFGEKDFQQLRVIQQMVRDFLLPIRVQGCPLVREADGLAMSSRNQYLTDEERKLAPQLYLQLQQLQQWLAAGENDYRACEAKAAVQLNALGFVVDYLSIVEPDTLALAEADSGAIAIIAAATLGKTRLLDNIMNIDMDTAVSEQ